MHRCATGDSLPSKLLELRFLLTGDVKPSGLRKVKASVKSTVRIFAAELAKAEVEYASVNMRLEGVQLLDRIREVSESYVHAICKTGRAIGDFDRELNHVVVRPDS